MTQVSNKTYVAGNKVKAYRVIQCECCNQFFEIDLSEVFDNKFEGGTKDTNIVCPWCEDENNFKFINCLCDNDRIVRYD